MVGQMYSYGEDADETYFTTFVNGIYVKYKMEDTNKDSITKYINIEEVEDILYDEHDEDQDLVQKDLKLHSVFHHNKWYNSYQEYESFKSQKNLIMSKRGLKKKGTSKDVISYIEKF